MRPSGRPEIERNLTKRKHPYDGIIFWAQITLGLLGFAALLHLIEWLFVLYKVIF